jgi:hypothetical protein
MSSDTLNMPCAAPREIPQQIKIVWGDGRTTEYRLPPVDEEQALFICSNRGRDGRHIVKVLTYENWKAFKGHPMLDGLELTGSIFPGTWISKLLTAPPEQWPAMITELRDGMDFPALVEKNRRSHCAIEKEAVGL